MDENETLITPEDVVELGILRQWTERDPEEPDEPATHWASVSLNPEVTLNVVFRPNDGACLMGMGESRKEAMNELHDALEGYWTYILDLSAAIKELADNLPGDSL